jgi:hypothetical protein
MTFPEFIRTRRVTRNDRGTFIIDAKKDQTLPDVNRWRRNRNNGGNQHETRLPLRSS